VQFTKPTQGGGYMNHWRTMARPTNAHQERVTGCYIRAHVKILPTQYRLLLYQLLRTGLCCCPTFAQDEVVTLRVRHTLQRGRCLCNISRRSHGKRLKPACFDSVFLKLAETSLDIEAVEYGEGYAQLRVRGAISRKRIKRRRAGGVSTLFTSQLPKMNRNTPQHRSSWKSR